MSAFQSTVQGSPLLAGVSAVLHNVGAQAVVSQFDPAGSGMRWKETRRSAHEQVFTSFLADSDSDHLAARPERHLRLKQIRIPLPIITHLHVCANAVGVVGIGRVCVSQ